MGLGRQPDVLRREVDKVYLQEEEAGKNVLWCGLDLKPRAFYYVEPVKTPEGDRAFFFVLECQEDGAIRKIDSDFSSYHAPDAWKRSRTLALEHALSLVRPMPGIEQEYKRIICIYHSIGPITGLEAQDSELVDFIEGQRELIV